MGDDTTQNPTSPKPNDPPAATTTGGGGWGGWGIPSFAVLSDLQKAAEEISKNAVAAAKTAAKGITDLQTVPSDSESEDEASKEVATKDKIEDESDNIRKSALDKLEKASEESLLGQGLKAFDSSVETFTSGAWNVFGSAWKGGSDLVQKLEHSAANLTESGTFAPIIESGKTLTTKGIEMLEHVGKETMELIISETGLDVEKKSKLSGQTLDEQFEDVTFDRCFYIYGGPDHLEELEALSNHYALLFNRRKTKLTSEQKSFYDGKLKQVQQIFRLADVNEESDVEPDKGKGIETAEVDNGNELKILCDASVSKAADMAAGFAAALGGLANNEVVQRTENRLEGIHSEGVHRLSELCCFVVSNLLALGKSVISNANKSQNDNEEEDIVKMDWPEDSVSKAKVIRSKTKSMTANVEEVSKSFITGISDIIEAYAAAIKAASSDADNTQQASVQEKAHAISDLLRAGQATALDKIQDALEYLSYVVISTSMPAA